MNVKKKMQISIKESMCILYNHAVKGMLYIVSELNLLDNLLSVLHCLVSIVFLLSPQQRWKQELFPIFCQIIEDRAQIHHDPDCQPENKAAFTSCCHLCLGQGVGHSWKYREQMLNQFHMQ